MYKLLLIPLLLYSCKPQPENAKTDIPKPNILKVEDSLKVFLEIKDSIKLLAAKYLPTSYLYAYPGRRIYAFIDYNRNSKFHDFQKERFLKRDIDTSYINTTYWEQRKKLPVNSSEIPSIFKKKWMPLYKYKGEFYIFKDCDFQPMLVLNDTNFIVHSLGDDYSVAIKSTEKTRKAIRLHTFAQYDENEYYGNYIDIGLVDDQSGVYKINYRDECDYYTPIENINNFKIIVQECNRSMYNRLVKFDEVDCY